MLKRANTTFVNIAHKPTFQYLLLAVITLFAIALRFYKLGEWSFWIDEVYTMNRAKVVFDNLTSWPSLSEILMGTAFSFSGVNEWSARLAPVIIGAISIPLLYFPIRLLFDQTTALLASALLAVSPWHLFWSQNARFYTLLLLLYTLALLFFLIGVEKDRPWYVWLSMILLTFAIRERLTALFFVPVVLSYMITVKILPIAKPAGLRLKYWALMGLPIVMIGIRELANYFYGERIVSTDQFANYSTGVRASGVQVLFSLFVGNPGPSPFWLLSTIVHNLGIPLISLGFFTGIYLINKKNRVGLALMLGALVPLLSILILSPFVYSLDRYIFVSLSSWIILGAVGIRELFREFERNRIILALGITLLFLASPFAQDILYFKYQNGNRADWKSAYAFVSQNKLDGDAVYSSQPELGRYYLDEEVMFIRNANLDAIAQSSNQAWFIDNGWLNPNTRKWVRENGELVDVFDAHTPLETFTMRVYRYSPD